MARRRDNLTLDLHSLSFEGEFEIEDKVCQKLDQFLYPFLKKQGFSHQHVRIIVGRGLNSRNFIEGKNPLRYYTEQYLDSVGLKWRDESESFGGVILVEV